MSGEGLVEPPDTAATAYNGRTLPALIGVLRTLSLPALDCIRLAHRAKNRGAL